MPKLLNSTPAYRRHSSGAAFVEFNGHRHYLGAYGSKASRAEYDRLVGLWLANGRRLPGKPADCTTVRELVAAYWKHVQVYHKPTSGHGGEIGSHRIALRIVKQVAGDTAAADFGPLMLKAVRESMIAAGWTRGYINKQVRRVVRMFKWGTAEELVPAGIHQALESVEGLRSGKTSAPDPRPVEPVDPAVVEATLPHLSPPVAAMVRLQMLTGMRPGEAVIMRGCDLDRTNPDLWAYTPRRHKTQHHGIARTIYLGERCQAVLLPFLVGRRPDVELFSPAEAEADRFAKRAAARVTPAGQGNGPRARRARPREPGAAYTTQTYDHAILKACDRVFLPPPPLGPAKGEPKTQWHRRLTADQRAELLAWRKAHRWTPNQIRHTFATAARATHGLEAAQVLLGHKTLTVTQVYAVGAQAKARAVMGREG